MLALGVHDSWYHGLVLIDSLGNIAVLALGVHDSW